MKATREAIWSVLEARLGGHPVSLSAIYELVQREIPLDNDDWESDGHSSTRWQRNVRNVLQHRKETGELDWPERGYYTLRRAGSLRIPSEGSGGAIPDAPSPDAPLDEPEGAGEETGVADTFDDDPGSQPYSPDEIPPDREVITIPLDPPVKSLLDDIRSKQLIVNPEFQRRDVWDRKRKSRLIESLLLNIPIPVLFLAEDEDGTRVVVDGQQRLRAIEQFEAGQYALTGLEVLAGLNGKRWVDLTPKQGRAITNRALRCLVIAASSDPNLRFEVFERLNTGGVTLNDQELRNSVYRGPLNNLLNELATSQEWLAILDRQAADNRLQHHEMVLRFLAFHEWMPRYRPPLKAFLNDFMKAERRAREETLDRYRRDFYRALTGVQVVFARHGTQPFRRVTSMEGEVRWDRTLNRAVFELQMLGLMDESQARLIDHADAIVDQFARLCTQDADFADAISRATADRARTRLRHERWGRALRELGITTSLLDRLPEQPA